MYVQVKVWLVVKMWEMPLLHILEFFLDCVWNTNDTCWLIDSLNWNLMQADLIYLLWDFWVEASLKSVGVSAVLWLWVVFKMPELHKAFLLSSYVYELCLLPFINRICNQIHVWFCLQDDFNCVSTKCSVRHLQLPKNKAVKCSIAATISVQKTIAIEEWEPNILFLLIWSLQQMQQFIFEQCRDKHKICKFFVNFVSLWDLKGPKYGILHVFLGWKYFLDGCRWEHERK